LQKPWQGVVIPVCSPKTVAVLLGTCNPPAGRNLFEKSLSGSAANFISQFSETVIFFLTLLICPLKRTVTPVLQADLTDRLILQIENQA